MSLIACIIILTLLKMFALKFSPVGGLLSQAHMHN